MRRNLTSEQVKEIVKLYPNTKSSVTADMYGVSVNHIYKTAQRYGVKKSEEFMNSDNSGRIKKGQRLSINTEFKKGVPFRHKGKKKAEYTKKPITECSTWWKKGNKPYNTAKDGEVRWREGVGFYFIRLAENEWEFYHRYLWKEAHGEIPENYNIVFKDGNRKNCKLENLECLSNAELGERNRITKYPLELRKAIINNNKLIRNIKNYEKTDRNRCTE